MNTDVILYIIMASMFVVGMLAGYGKGFKEGKEEGYALGRSVARHTFWSE